MIKIMSALFLLVLSTWARAGVIEVIEMQTPVKSQGAIGSCSIFSATALLESKLLQLGEPDSDDLSEQWLLYITAAQKGSVGVLSEKNIEALSKYGYLPDYMWEFSPIPWDNLGSLAKIFDRKCSSISDAKQLAGCRIGRRNPLLLQASEEDLTTRGSGLFDQNFNEIRNHARDNNSKIMITGTELKPQDAKKRLDKNEAILLDVNFFFEAWSHAKTAKLGLDRNMDLFHSGIVSFPHKDSMDYAVSTSPDHRTAHSVLVVGYDPDVVIERTVKKVDGSPMTVRSKGVYYFKNSWGTGSFGKNFQVNDRNFPGYGMIAMAYAERSGKFWAMNVSRK